MGDLSVNKRALEDVIGRAMPVHGSSVVRPDEPNAFRIAEPFEVIDLLTMDLALPQLHQWRGYAVALARDGTTAGATARLMFESAKDGRGILLHVGEAVEVPRGFERVFVQDGGGTVGTLRFVVTRDPFVHGHLSRPVHLMGDEALGVVTPANTPLNVAGTPASPPVGGWRTAMILNPGNGAITLDAGVLGPGDYEVRAHTGTNALLQARAAFEHRNAANDDDINSFEVHYGGATAGSPAHAPLLFLPRITAAANERFRWKSTVAITGRSTFSIYWRKVA